MLPRYKQFHSFYKNDVCADLARDVATRFGTSNYKVQRPLPVGENKSHWITPVSNKRKEVVLISRELEKAKS